MEGHIRGGPSWTAPFVLDVGDGYSYPNTLLQGENILGQPWPTTFVSDFDVGAFPGPSGGVEIQQGPLGLPPPLQQLLPLWSEDNIVEGQPWSAAFVSNFDVGAFPDLSGSVGVQQAPLGLPPAPRQPPPSFPCTYLGCVKSFKRDSDRTRHQNTVHRVRQGLHLCPVPGCYKSHGAGFSRADKVAEHKWKKHANLGYTKRVL